MAYNADNETKEELAKIQKNNRGDFIVASKITNKNTGAVSIDIRQNYTNDEGELRLTQKGVRLNAELLPDLVRGLVKALEENEVMDLGDELAELLADSDDEDADDEEGDIEE